MLRAITIMLAIVYCACAAAQDAKSVRYVGRESPYPLWDGKESVADYARKTGLDPEISFDLGDGVKLELVLIPAGKFVMGFPEPQPPAIPVVYILAPAVAALTFPFAHLFIHFVLARYQKKRLQVSLKFLLVSVLAFGVGGVLVVEWRDAAEAWNSYSEKHKEWEWKVSDPYSGIPNAEPVVIRRPFYLGKYELTGEQVFRSLGGVDDDYNRLPADVYFDKGIEITEQLSSRFQYLFRLPFETEWEFACRAGTTTGFFFGDAVQDNYQESKRFAYFGETQPVGKAVPNSFGLFDMHGNAWECCYWDNGKAAERPFVYRGGGSNMMNPDYAHSYDRVFNFGEGGDVLGLRVLMEIPPEWDRHVKK